MDIILSQLFFLYIFILLGYFLGKVNKGLNAHTGILSFLAVNVFLPAKVFGSFSTYFTVSYISGNYKLLLISLALLLLLHLAGKLAGKLLKGKGIEKGVYEYTVTISNYSYMGYALVEGVFGSMALTDMILFCLPFSLYTYTIGYVKLTGGRISPKRLLNPITLASFIGMIVGLTGLQLPAVIGKVMAAASSCVGPITMLLTGLTLSEFTMRRMLGDGKVYVMTAIRLVILPLTVFLLFKGLHLEVFMASALLMAAMPSGLNTIIFPKNIGASPELGAKLALVTHAFSCVTLPFWLMLVQ